MGVLQTQGHIVCWSIKDSGVCTGGKDTEIVAEIFGQDEGQRWHQLCT